MLIFKLLNMVLWVVGAQHIIVRVFGRGALFILRQLGSKESRKVAKVSISPSRRY